MADVFIDGTEAAGALLEKIEVQGPAAESGVVTEWEFDRDFYVNAKDDDDNGDDDRFDDDEEDDEDDEDVDEKFDELEDEEDDDEENDDDLDDDTFDDDDDI